MKQTWRVVPWVAVFSASFWGNGAEAQIWPTAHAKIERALASNLTEERRAAATRLHALLPSVSRTFVARLIHDPDAQVRSSVGQLILARRYREFAPRVHAWLSDGDANIRQLGARVLALGGVGDEQVVLLARLLSDPVADVRRTAAAVLSQAETPVAAQVLLNHLGDNSDAVRLAVIDALGALGSPVATLPLLSRLQDANVAVRRAAVDALGEIDDSNAMGGLSLALLDADGDVREAAVRAIGHQRRCEAVDAVRERLRVDRDVSVRVAAVDTLARLGEYGGCDPKARTAIAETLVGALGHAQQEVRDEASNELERSSGIARPQLRACLSESSLTAVSAINTTAQCARALAHADRNARPSPNEPTANELDTNAASGRRVEAYDLIMAAWRNGQLLDAEWLEVLALGQYEDALPATLDLLTRPSAQVRSQALDTAFVLLDPTRADGRAVDPLVAFLSASSSLDETARALTVLGHTGAQRAVVHLIPFTHVDAPLVLRIAAFRALAEIKGAQVSRQTVGAALTSDSRELRDAVARSIREGEWTGLGETLVTLLRQATYEEVEGVANALWGVARRITEPPLVAAFAHEVTRALPRHQDALLEAFGRLPWQATERYWPRWLGTLPCPAQAKIAEVLAAHDQSKQLLVRLLHSKCDGVVANALWSLRRFTLDESLFSELVALLRRNGSALTGNAVAALANVRSVSDPIVQANTNGRVLRILCEGLAQQGWGPIALSNALTALRLHAHRCTEDGESESALLQHPVAHVRKRAAHLLLARQQHHHAASPLRAHDARALRRCARTDLDGAVAAACLGDVDAGEPGQPRWVTIAVVPEPEREPRVNAPYLLEVDGWIRSGTTDRRGAVFEEINNAADAALLWF